MTAERISPQRIEYRRIVVKVGSNVLTGGSEALDTPTMAHIAEQIASLESRGAEVIVITSGAIAAGRHRLTTHRESHSLPARDIESRQALAAIGQSRLMAFWDELFEQHNLPIAQALLTRRDLADRLGYLNARNTLLNLIGLRVVPIVNENDVVSVEEISDSKIGDNDNLSAQVANLVDADLVQYLKRMNVTDVSMGLESGNERALRYNTDEDTVWVYSPDPESNRWDHTANPMDWAKSRIAISDKLMGDIEDWAMQDDDPYEFLRRAFIVLTWERSNYFQFVARVIGGQYFSRTHKGDPDAPDPLTLVDPQMQRDALALLR